MHLASVFKIPTGLNLAFGIVYPIVFLRVFFVATFESFLCLVSLMSRAEALASTGCPEVVTRDILFPFKQKKCEYPVLFQYFLSKEFSSLLSVQFLDFRPVFFA